MASKVVLALGLVSTAMAGYCSRTPKLELTNIDYEARYAFSGAGNLTSRRAAISFDLSSDGGDLSCEGISQAHPTYFDATSKYECTSDYSDSPSPFNATFTFNKASNMLAVEARYACYNYTARAFDVYETAANAMLNLTCDQTLYENKNFVAGAVGPAGISSAGHTTCDTSYLVIAPGARLADTKSIYQIANIPPPAVPTATLTAQGILAAPPTAAVTRATTIIAGATPAPASAVEAEAEFDFDDDEDEELRKKRRAARLRKLRVAA